MFRERTNETARTEARSRGIAARYSLHGKIRAEAVDPPAPKLHGVAKHQDASFVPVALHGPDDRVCAGRVFRSRAAWISSDSFARRKTVINRSW